MIFINYIKSILYPFYKEKRLKEIFKILNFENQNSAMLVGGCVRNFLNKEPIGDIDIATTIKPQEIVDLEKPEDEDITLKWNEMMDRANKEAPAAVKMEQATAQLKDWKEKLVAFNKKVPQPEDKPVEIIQEDLQKKMKLIMVEMYQ